jgi:hypothetical protein
VIRHRGIGIVRSEIPIAFTILLGGALVTGVYTIVSPWVAFVTVVGLTATVTVCLWPIVGLVGFALTASVFPFAAPGGESITIAEALLLATWLAVLLNCVLGRAGFNTGPTERAVLVLLAFTLLPCILGIVLIPEGQLGFVRWFRWALNVSTVFLVGAVVREQRHVWAVLVATIIGAAIMLVIALVIYVPHHDSRDFIPLLEWARYARMDRVEYNLTSFHDRMGSTWIHPNLLGGYLALIVPIACMMILILREPWRFAAILFALLAIAGLFLSISRAAMIGFGTSLLWFVRRRVPYSLAVLVGGLVFAVVLVATSAHIEERLSGILVTSNIDASSTAVRLDEYAAFPTAMMRYPFGIGFAVDPTSFVENKPDLRQISNLWLNYIYRTSVVGMLLFLWTNLRWWCEVKPGAKIDYADPLTIIHVGMVGGLLGTFVIGLFDHYFSFQVVLVAFWWMFVGLTLSTGRQLREAAAARMPGPLRTTQEIAVRY